jgi:hypothetical protein
LQSGGGMMNDFTKEELQDLYAWVNIGIISTKPRVLTYEHPSIKAIKETNEPVNLLLTKIQSMIDNYYHIKIPTVADYE